MDIFDHASKIVKSNKQLLPLEQKYDVSSKEIKMAFKEIVPLIVASITSKFKESPEPTILTMKQYATREFSVNEPLSFENEEMFNNFINQQEYNDTVDRILDSTSFSQENLKDLANRSLVSTLSGYGKIINKNNYQEKEVLQMFGGVNSYLNASKAIRVYFKDVFTALKDGISSIFKNPFQ